MKIVNIHAPGTFQLDALPAPDIGADDALIRVKACGICGSDIAYIDAGGAGFGKNRAPALGHEAAGEIVALGANVAGFALGERVAINPIDPVLRNAIGNGAPEGAFGNVVAVRNAARQGRLLKLPASLSYEIAALAEPMGVALHTVNRSGAAPGDKVVVIGVGPIGAGAVIWLKHKGVSSVVAVDLSMERLERAKRLGADHIVLAGQGDLREQLSAIHGTIAAGQPDTDIFLDAAASPIALADIVSFAKFGSKIAVVGVYKKPVEIDLNVMLHKEMTLVTSMGYPTELAEVVDFLGKNDRLMREYISDRYPFEDFSDALGRARHRDSGKVMVYMPE